MDVEGERIIREVEDTVHWRAEEYQCVSIFLKDIGSEVHELI